MGLCVESTDDCELHVLKPGEYEELMARERQRREQRNNQQKSSPKQSPPTKPNIVAHPPKKDKSSDFTSACDGQEAHFEALSRQPTSKRTLDQWKTFLDGFVTKYQPMRDYIIGNPSWISEIVSLAVFNTMSSVVGFREDMPELATLLFKTIAIVLRQRKLSFFLSLVYRIVTSLFIALISIRDERLFL